MVAENGVPFKPYYQDDRCTIYCGDCRQVLPFLPKADLVLTDPPYGIKATKQTLGKGKKEFHRGNWDNTIPRNLNQVVDAANFVCVWGGNYLTRELEPTNDWLIWHKNNDGRSFSECEMAWTNFGCQSRHLTHHWGGEEKRHPTQKPLAVIKWCISLAPIETELIIDPFMGSGTTIVAANIDGIKSIGIELEEQYCEIAAKRLEQGVLF